MANKRVLIWIYELDRNLLKSLREENIEVVALLGGVSEDVPSFSIYDLFYRTAKLPFDQHAANPIELSDAFMYRYLDCVSRVSFMPLTEECNYVDIGIIGADNVADWAQFHAQTLLHLFQHYAPDEIWLLQKPHLGIDNLAVEIGRQLGLPVFTFFYSMMPGKFFYERNGDSSTSLDLEFTTPEIGAFRSNLFFMKRYDKMPALERLADRSGFYMTAPFKVLFNGQRKQTINRIYLAAQRRQWAPLLFLMDCLCKSTREHAFKRFVRRIRSRASLKKRVMCNQDDLQKPFVYFALQLQPEESTSALGGFFSNQVNAIEAIREILPDGWWICIKENPYQRYMYRDWPFYMRTRQWPDVKFIDDSANSQDLIKKSRIVASITGTVGYEALLMDKPCVHFGEAWYGGLPNAFRFKNTLDLEEISCLKGDAQELNEAMKAKMRLAGDGLVYPWAYGYYDQKVDWPELMRTTAKSLARISNSATSSEHCNE